MSWVSRKLWKDNGGVRNSFKKHCPERRDVIFIPQSKGKSMEQRLHLRPVLRLRSSKTTRRSAQDGGLYQTVKFAQDGE